MTTKPPTPPQRGATIRQALRAALERAPGSTLHELSGQVGIPEKEVAAHLLHLQRSLRRSGAQLLVEPARCVACGFVFRKRDRLSRPTSCPACGERRVEPQRFSVDGGE